MDAGDSLFSEFWREKMALEVRNEINVMVLVGRDKTCM